MIYIPNLPTVVRAKVGVVTRDVEITFAWHDGATVDITLEQPVAASLLAHLEQVVDQ